MSPGRRLYSVVAVGLVAVAVVAFLVGRSTGSGEAPPDGPAAAERAEPQRVNGLGSAPGVPALREPQAPANTAAEPPSVGIGESDSGDSSGGTAPAPTVPPESPPGPTPPSDGDGDDLGGGAGGVR